MKELIGGLETSVRDVFRDVLMDTTTSLADRLIIYSRAGETERRLVYDLVKPIIEAEFKASPLAGRITFEVAFPEPPGMEEHRLQEAAKKNQEREIDKRDKFETK